MYLFTLLLLLLLLSRFSRVRLCATPEMAAHRALLSLGFSRQEHWSGLPFPSPVHESEKGKWSCSVVSGSSRPPGLQPSRRLRPRESPGRSAGVGCHRLLRQLATEPGFFCSLVIARGLALLLSLVFTCASNPLLLPKYLFAFGLCLLPSAFLLPFEGAF